MKELDNRGSHFYLALYWAQALADQNEDQELKEQFQILAKKLVDNEEEIIRTLNEVQGKKMDLGGYYDPNPDKVSAAMRPCDLFNGILAEV